MLNLKTGKTMTRRDFGRGLAGILAAGVAPSLCAATAGGYRRGLAARMAAMGGEGSDDPFFGRNILQLKLTDASSLDYSFVSATNISGKTCLINWGDGTVNSSLSHTYSSVGEYNVELFNVKDFTCQKNTNKAIKVYTSNEITSLPQAFCYGNSELTEWISDSTLTSIGNYIFYRCGKLKKIGDLSSLTTGVFRQAFENDYELVEVGDIGNVGNAVNSFLNCTGLKKVGNIRCTGVIGLFKNCTSLREIGTIYNATGITIYGFVGTKIPIVRAPNVSTVDQSSFNGCTVMSRIELGTISSLGLYAFYNLGKDLVAVDGIKSTIKVGNTMDSTLALSNFSNNQTVMSFTKVECSDGYLKNINGTWTKFPES